MLGGGCETEGSRATAGPRQSHARPVFWLKLLRVNDGGGGRPPASVIHLQPRPLNLNASPAERSYLTEVALLLSFVAEETPGGSERRWFSYLNESQKGDRTGFGAGSGLK